VDVVDPTAVEVSVAGPSQMIEVGDVIVNAQEPYFLRKVTSVTTEQGRLLLRTEQAALTDAIRDGHISETIVLPVAAAGNLKLAGPQDGMVLMPLGGQTISTSEGLSLRITSGELVYEPRFELDLDIVDRRIEHFRFSSIGQLDVTWDIQIAVPGALDIEARSMLGEWPLAEVVILVGPVPILLGAVVEAYMGVQAVTEGGGEVAVRCGVHKGTGMAVEFRNGVWGYTEGSSPVWEHEVGNVTIPRRCSLRAFVELQVNVEVWRAVGPGIGLTPYIQAEVAQAPRQAAWALNGGFSAFVGAHFGLFGWQIADYRHELAWTEARLAEGVLPLPNQAPEAMIVVPAQQTRYQYGETVGLGGRAVDPEDGALSGSALAWSSDLDGRLGSGSPLAISDMSVGTHTIQMTATDSDGESGSATIEITILPEENRAPYTPSNPSPSHQATGQSRSVTLSWSGGDPDGGDSVTYDVYFGTDSNPDSGELVSTARSSRSYSPGTLSSGTRYYWMIVAKDNHGRTTQGPVWRFDTQPGSTNRAPNVPSNPSPPVQSGQPWRTDVKLEWEGGDPDGDSVTYEVYMVVGEGWQVIGTTVEPELTLPTVLEGDTWYFWKVIARDSAGNSSEGEVWRFATYDHPYIELMSVNDAYSSGEILRISWKIEALDVTVDYEISIYAPDGRSELVRTGRVQRGTVSNGVNLGWDTAGRAFGKSGEYRLHIGFSYDGWSTDDALSFSYSGTEATNEVGELVVSVSPPTVRVGRAVTVTVLEAGGVGVTLDYSRSELKLVDASHRVVDSVVYEASGEEARASFIGAFGTDYIPPHGRLSAESVTTGEGSISEVVQIFVRLTVGGIDDNGNIVRSGEFPYVIELGEQ